jgi:hypothetical protein
VSNWLAPQTIDVDTLPANQTPVFVPGNRPENRAQEQITPTKKKKDIISPQKQFPTQEKIRQ